MKGFAKVWSREWRMIGSRKTVLFLTLVGPLLGFFLVMYIFSANVPRKLPVAMVDEDHSAMSRKIAQYVSACPIASIENNFMNPGDASLALERGEVEAVVYIPAGTEKEILRGRSTAVELYVNNANVLKGGLITSGIRKALATLSSGIKIQMLMKTGLRQEEATNRALPVQVRQVTLFNPYTNYSYYLTAALLPVILVLFIMLGTTYGVGIEFYKGTGKEWMRLSSGSIGTGILAKILPYTVMYFLMAQVMNLLLFGVMGMPVHGHLWQIILAEIFLIIAYQSIVVFFVGLTTNMRLSMALSSAYSMLSITYCGLTFPLFGMPAFSKAFSMLFPFSWFLKILVGQSLRGEPTTDTLLPVVVMTSFILLGLAMIPRINLMLYNEKRWGKS